MAPKDTKLKEEIDPGLRTVHWWSGTGEIKDVAAFLRQPKIRRQIARLASAAAPVTRQVPASGTD